MEIPGLSRATARLAHALRHAEPAVLAALGLLALAAALQWGGAAAARARIAQLQEEDGVAQARLARSTRERERLEALSPAARAEQFYRFFPPARTAPDWLEKIHDAAAKHGVQLAQADYRMVHSSAHRLLAYEVSCPLKGSYAQLRRFLAQVLREVPNASLDEVSFRRDSVGQAEVLATVKLTVHLKEGP